MTEMIIERRCFVTGDDVTAEQILPVEYVTFDLDDPDERRMLGPYALSGAAERFGELHAGLTPGSSQTPAVDAGAAPDEGGRGSARSIVIAGRRFGAGSARPHAAVALAEAGVRVVIAASFGEGFFRAAVNRACLYPIRVSLEASEEMLRTIALDDRLRIDLDRGCITRLAPGCGAGDFADGWAFEPLGVIRAIIERGGLLAHIEQAGYPTTRLANNPRGQGSNQIG